MAQNPYEFSFILRKQLEKKILKILLFIVFLFLFITLFLRFILYPVIIKSDSMEPTLKTNSVIFVTPLIDSSEHLIGNIPLERGILVLTEPQYVQKRTVLSVALDSFVSFFSFQQFFPSRTTTRITGTPTVKRLLAIPGDTIYMKDYILYIKPQGESHFLTEFEIIPYSYDIQINSKQEEWTGLGVTGDFEEITLGENEYFLLCDKRDVGIDSRIWGAVPDTKIDGKVLLCYFPFNRFQLFTK